MLLKASPFAFPTAWLSGRTDGGRCPAYPFRALSWAPQLLNRTQPLWTQLNYLTASYSLLQPPTISTLSRKEQALQDGRESVYQCLYQCWDKHYHEGIQGTNERAFFAIFCRCGSLPISTTSDQRISSRGFYHS